MTGLIPLPPGTAPGLAPRWQELFAAGAEVGTAAPRLRDLSRVELRSGPLFAEAGFTDRLRARHARLGSDAASQESIDALAAGAACVVTGQQPHLLAGPFYTAWKILGAIALAQRLSELHETPVVPVYWCGSDDADFDEVSAAWLFDAGRGPWRLSIPAGEWHSGQPVGDVAAGRLAALEEAALVGLHGAGMDWLRATAPTIPDTGLADRASAWLLRMFRDSGLVVIDARDDLLAGAARPLLERYAGSRAEVARAVEERVLQRSDQGWAPALDPAARESGIFALREGRRVKVTPEELDAGSAMRWSWSPSVLLRPVVQDALLAPVAAVLGPGELAYHAEIPPVYEALGVVAARPVPRPHLTLTGSSWGWPSEPGAVARLLAGGGGARAELARLGLSDVGREAFDEFSADLDKALGKIELRLARPMGPRARARFDREVRRLQKAEVDRSGGSVERRAQWLARGRRSQERVYSSWLLWAWCADPVKTVLGPLAAAWIGAIDRAEAVQWALPLEEIR